MYQTIQVSSCVSVQGDFVELLPNGDMLIRDGMQLYRGRPIAPQRRRHCPRRSCAPSARPRHTNRVERRPGTAPRRAPMAAWRGWRVGPQPASGRDQGPWWVPGASMR